MDSIFTDQRLGRIAARASTLPERLEGDFIPDQVVQHNEHINHRVKAWAKAIGKGDIEQVERRLALGGLTLKTVRSYLGRVSLKEGGEFPPWVTLLPEIVERAARYPLDYLLDGTPSSEPFIDAEKPQPFEDILIPLVKYGNRLLFNGAEATPNLGILSDAARSSLSRYLLHRLTLISSRVLHREFWLYRVERKPILALVNLDTLTKEADQPENALYGQFVQQVLSEENLLALLEEYCVLARLLVEEINTWVDVVGEFLARLTNDWDAIEDQFGKTGTYIKDIEAGLSDSHNNGRMVFRLEFESGLKLIYKPHSMAMESAYQAFVSWINDQGSLLPLKSLRLIDMDTHGWVGLIEHQPCETPAEMERYYYRVGMLICLMYLLSGTDFHYENIIANGEFPIPVDLEMLLYPPMASDLDDVLDHSANSWERLTTIFHSTIVPFGNPQLQGGVDSSFLGASAEKQSVTRKRLKYINRDAMHWVDESFEIDPHKNNSGVIFEGELQRPHEYRQQILAGFEDTYYFLINNREVLLGASGPLSWFINLPTRFVFRATQIYYKVWLSSLEAKCLRDGVDRQIQLEHLARAYLQEEIGVQRYWKLFREEIAALTQNDIPLFYMTTDSLDLTTPGGDVIPGCFLTSGYQRVLGNLRNLSAADLQRQRRFIRQALVAKRISVAKADELGVQKTIVPSSAPNNTELFLSEAQAIAKGLLEQTLFDGRSAFWTDLQMDLVSENYYVRYLEDDLYSGSSGVALFLAAMRNVTGEARYTEYAMGALENIRQRVKRGHFQSFIKLGIGGAAGIGSLVYALLRCAEFLGEDALLADAEALAKTITPELIEQDESLDVIAGSAGAILGLVPLYQVTKSEQVLKIANACGQHLLMKHVDVQTGGRAWPTIDGKLLAGFSHGAAGISYALLKLYQVTGDKEYHSAAEDAITYEGDLYDPQVCNWPDLRVEEGFMTSWCHGAPGIALARLGSLSDLDNEDIRNDIHNGLKTTLDAVHAATDGQQDHLCCGHFGRAEILFTAGQLLGNKEYTKAALNFASALVSQARQDGGYNLLHGLPPDIPQPGFFNGLAGIGYTCLRFAQFDNSLPSMLLWE